MIAHPIIANLIIAHSTIAHSTIAHPKIAHPTIAHPVYVQLKVSEPLYEVRVISKHDVNLRMLFTDAVHFNCLDGLS